ncbi:MAG TPA: lamin tail domain-containing protein [Saprospiraceae bacterium]|nr:lamin tail domain-containing protein [Saprospiraceae bacterium]
MKKKSTIFWLEMKRLVYCFSLLIYSQLLHSQWIENFERFDTTVWKGQVSHFGISQDAKLMLQAPVAGRSFVFREYELGDKLDISFFTLLTFAPSSSNQLRIYLNLSSPDLAKADSYYLEIGETGSQDRWKFYKRQSGTTTLLGEGLFGKLAVDPAMVRMKIEREGNGVISISTDYTGGNSYTLEKTISDQDPIQKAKVFFGIECIYTETRKDKFFFDDISTGFLPQDQQGPKIISIETKSDDLLLVSFDESLDTNYCKDPSLYVIPSLGPIQKVNVITENELELKLSGRMMQNNSYELHCSSAKDKNGNLSNQLVHSFKYTHFVSPSKLDLLISEIMADPSPKVGLPEAEFVELINVSKNTLNLQDCELTDGAAHAIFPIGELAPSEIAILCSMKDTSLFKPFGKVIGLPSFPSINNTGDHLFLLSPNGDIIHDVPFSDSWYSNPIKKEGGYSLEMVSPFKACDRASNWIASIHPLGGTPGQVNSRWNPEKDTLGPKLIDVTAISEWEVRLSFDEALDESFSTNINLYQLSPLRSIATADLVLIDLNAVILLLNEKLEKGINYNLTVSEIKDCLGNSSYGLQWQDLKLPKIAEKGELVFNEVLFNPFTGGADFIELFNKSNTVISLQKLFLKNPEKENQWIAIKTDRSILPKREMAFTFNPSEVLSKYTVSDSTQIIKTSIPSIDDAGGTLVLGVLNELNQIEVLDSFSFKEQWHHPFIKITEGVSLERSNQDGPSYEQFRWHSASASVGFATPGTTNSNWIVIDTAQQKTKNWVNINERVISPDGNGFRDWIAIQFNLDRSDYLVLIDLYDMSGNKVKEIFHQIISPQEKVVWYGEDSSGSLLTSGNYILHILALHPEGDKKTYKDYLVIDNK